MNILVNDQKILEKYNKIWDKIKNLFGKEFDSERVYDDKYIKAKINLYYTNFYDKKTPIESEHCTCFSVILLILLLVQIKNIVCKYFEKNASMQQRKKDNECN